MAKTCENHPIYCQILKNNPTINENYAFELSNIIYSATQEYGLEGQLYAAILMQESSYDLEVINCGKNGCDLGIAQVNSKTADSYGFDPELLIGDLEYSIFAGAKVLAWFRANYKNKEPQRWFCRYNTGTRKAEAIRSNCTKYIKSVNKWL